MAEVFAWPVDLSDAAQEVKYAARVVQFGDGYEQRQAKSLKKKSQSWKVSKTGFKTEIEKIEAFLDAHAGVASFWWRRSGAADLRVAVDGYNKVPLGGLVWKISFTFREVVA